MYSLNISPILYPSTSNATKPSSRPFFRSVIADRGTAGTNGLLQRFPPSSTSS